LDGVRCNESEAGEASKVLSGLGVFRETAKAVRIFNLNQKDTVEKSGLITYFKN